LRYASTGTMGGFGGAAMVQMYSFSEVGFGEGRAT
jgi:hypothetical protein